jgi:hypothetical protein
MALNGSHAYTVVDVFTTEPLAGNPLAVFADASEFDAVTMQRIARESSTWWKLPLCLRRRVKTVQPACAYLFLQRSWHSRSGHEGPPGSSRGVYCKRPFGGPDHVLRYLGAYTHRVAISNHRLVSFAEDRVTFRWRDPAHNNQKPY